MLENAVTGEYKELPVIVLDPTPASVAKVAGKYRYKIIMKTINNSLLRKMTERLLIEFSRSAENKSVSVFVDINPEYIL